MKNFGKPIFEWKSETQKWSETENSFAVKLELACKAKTTFLQVLHLQWNSKNAKPQNLYFFIIYYFN